MRAPALSLDDARDRYADRRAFVLGNAPSLAELPLHALRDEHVFLVNRGYRAFDLGLSGRPWLVVSDPQTYEAYADEIRGADVGGRFYRADVKATDSYGQAPRVELATTLPFHMEPTMDDGAFALDARDGLHRGFTVVLDAVQLAYHMGFRDVVICGVELAWTRATTHFYGTGAYEQDRIGDWPAHRANSAFAVARRAFESDGRQLRNATPGGNLTTLKRVAFAGVVAASAGSAP